MSSSLLIYRLRILFWHFNAASREDPLFEMRKRLELLVGH